MAKDAGAFRTIGELSDELGIAQHILRYWETRFPQLRPLTRAGNRRYYRPDDIALVKRINRLLNEDGYTIRGVQKILEGGAKEEPKPVASLVATPKAGRDTEKLVSELKDIRDTLAEALAD
ncbi:MAG: MerR family transcriptional regulator [Sphingomonadaceae bacterium]|nr:MerR family transcriptional regulator [Sphingomonadaceae bacterium]